ncbi:MAG TPA: hypothetical protein PKY12_12790 [Catalimonadaceae bacterium]|nr:hypothetical protein [Catalimonadaceae bacterium]
MKNIFAIFLILSYLAGSLGLKINQHFCCGELVSTGIVEEVTENLLLEFDQADSTNEGCCSNKVISLKVDDGPNQAKTFIQKLSQTFAVVPVEANFFVLPFLEVQTRILSIGKSPPGFFQSSFYILFRSLII